MKTNIVNEVLQAFKNKEYENVLLLSEKIDIGDLSLVNKLIVLNILGISYLKKNKLIESENFFLEALEIDDKNIETLYNISNLYLKKKNYLISFKYLKKILEQNPYFLKAYYLLLSLKKYLRNPDDIENILLNLTRLKLENLKLEEIILLINYLSKNNELVISKFLCQKLLPKKNYHIHFLYGLILRKLDDFELSLKYFLLAYRANPKDSFFAHEVGSVYEILGNLEEAKKFYKTSIHINPDFSLGYRSLADLKCLKENDKNILEEKIKEKKNNFFLIHAYYALSKYYSDISDYKKSYSNLTEANRLKNSELNYDGDRYKKISKFYTKFKSNDDLKRKFERKANEPIFIVGLPRSGSTLLEQILNSHSKIFGFGEVDSLQNNLEKYIYNSDTNSSLTENQNDYDLYKNVRTGYYDNFKFNNKKLYFVDKMLFNFFYINFISNVFPFSKIIICKRDLRDVFLSILKNYFGSSAMSFAYNEENLLDFIFTYSNHINQCIKNNKNIIIVEYENLVNNPSETVKKLMNRLELDFEHNCLEFYKKKSEVNTASSFQVRSKINTKSVNLWSKYEKFYKNSFKRLEEMNLLI